MSECVFRFSSTGLEVEFTGPETFVEGQIALLESRILRELGLPAVAELPSSPPTLEEFTRRARSREGRGALQETILIFAYYLSRFREEPQFTIEDILACFSAVKSDPPRSLANTLGVMKRKQGMLASGPKRGTYSLTEKGAEYVEGLIGT